MQIGEDSCLEILVTYPAFPPTDIEFYMLLLLAKGSGESQVLELESALWYSVFPHCMVGTELLKEFSQGSHFIT
jgi:hypothetical protein